MRIGIFGDLGDTSNSSTTLQHLQANSPDMVLNTGDMVRALPALAAPLCACTAAMLDPPI